MKVIELRDDWGLEHVALGSRPEPRLAPGEVLIKLEAASLNYRDYVIVHRGYGRYSGELPLIPVSDAAGRVVETGDGVQRIKTGDLVCPLFAPTWFSGPLREEYRMQMLGGPLDGVMREYMAVSERAVIQPPVHFTAEEAATLPCAALTAWHAVTASNVQAGDFVVTQGTGGVSLFALMFAKQRGARVAITSSSDEKLAHASNLGADLLINYRAHPDWHRAVRRIAPQGADLIIELGGAGTLEQSLRAVRVSGTIALIGVLAGAKAELDLGRAVTQNIRLQGITLGNRLMFEEMVQAIERHKLRPPIDPHRFTFEETRQAIGAIVAGRHFGKIVIGF